MTPPLTVVTGAPGWLGTHLVRALVKGLPDVPSLAEPKRERRIRCLVFPGTDTEVLRSISESIEVVEGDIREPESLKPFFKDAGGATMFHLAGIIHPRRIRDLYAINTDGAKNCLNVAIRAGVKRFIAVSSNSPAGCNPYKDHLFDESMPPNPYMHYGWSKKLMEDAVNKAHQDRSIETVILRPCWFYGPGQPPRQTAFFSMIKEGKVPIVGDGENRRSMTYVDNACQGLLLAETSERACGQTYWIADRRPYTMNEIIDTVERLLKTEFNLPVAHKRLRLPALASEIAWLCDRVVQGIGRYSQKIHVLSEMNKTIACSSAKAERELGYTPRIELEEGMRRSIAWILERTDGL